MVDFRRKNSYRRLSALRWRGRHGAVSQVPIHTCQQLNRSKNSYATIKPAGVPFFAVVCRRGSGETGEASRINKLVLKKGWLLQPEGSSRAEGRDQAEICLTQNHPPPPWWADVVKREPPASGFYPQGATWSALGALLCQQPSDCTIPVVWVAPLTASRDGAEAEHLYLLYKLTWSTYALKWFILHWLENLYVYKCWYNESTQFTYALYIITFSWRYDKFCHYRYFMHLIKGVLWQFNIALWGTPKKLIKKELSNMPTSSL